jgi:hypothetical protein
MTTSSFKGTQLRAWRLEKDFGFRVASLAIPLLVVRLIKRFAYSDARFV